MGNHLVKIILLVKYIGQPINSLQYYTTPFLLKATYIEAHLYITEEARWLPYIKVQGQCT